MRRLKYTVLLSTNAATSTHLWERKKKEVGTAKRHMLGNVRDDLNLDLSGARSVVSEFWRCLKREGLKRTNSGYRHKRALKKAATIR